MQIWGLHNITLQTFTFNLMLLPAIPLGAFLGIKITKLIPENAYKWFVVVATLLSAVALFFS
jgi:uncharacterized protein